MLPTMLGGGFEPQSDLHRVIAAISGAEKLQAWPCREAAPENSNNVNEIFMDLQRGRYPNHTSVPPPS